MSLEIISGAAPAALGNALSDAIHDALEQGMEVDVACCIAIKVAFDYWRQTYDTPFLVAAHNIISAETSEGRA